MAIKISNQITFTEQKKILEIREWYLATSKNSGVTTNPEEGWKLEVQTIDSTNKYLWNYEETVYSLGSSDITIPTIIGVYGESGSSLQIKYTISKTIPTIINNDVSGWSDTMPTQQDGYNIYMIQKLSNQNNWSNPIQISGTNGKDGSANIEINADGYWVINGEVTDIKAEGADGIGILEIQNFYTTTTNTSTPSWSSSSDLSNWKTNIIEATLTPTNKYLWNYERIQYTDNTYTRTSPAIIGVYGDSGTDAVDFQIYSTDGFEFSDALTSIELKTIAFQAGVKLKESDVSYQWKWWNTESDMSDKYEIISGATTSTLIINVDDIYAFTSIKCEMTYDNIVYEDYISLTKKEPIYTAVAKFFNGNNIITSDDDYLIVYVELYKDNNPEELLYGDSIYNSNANTIQGNIISTDLSGTYANGDVMYFVCKNTTTLEYDVVCGQYASGQWNLLSSSYIYNNDLFPNTTSPVVFIPKEKIPRSLSINFTVFNNDVAIARTNTTVLDLNDPTISSIAPTDPKAGQLWLDTSVSPSVLKMWDGTEWINSGYQNGNVVYTSKPEGGYSEGDLWILSEEDADIFEEFGEGTMLKAIVTSTTFNPGHWVDVDKEGTEQRKNIKQYFLFNADTGLRIGRSDNKFYVNISSTRMSFCENPLIDTTEIEEAIDPNEVVSIGNKSATIKNLTVEDGATFNCEVKFGNFILKTESSNGSLSLALAT